MNILSEATAKLLAPINLSNKDRLSISIDEKLKYFELEIFSHSSDGKRYSPSYSAFSAFPSRIPERQHSDGHQVFGTSKWKVAATDTTAAIIQAIWPPNQIIFKDEDACIVYNYLLTKIQEQELTAKTTADFKTHGIIPPHDLIVNQELPLGNYQVVAAINSHRSEGFGLFMEQGTGKTPVIIARICTEAEQLWKTEGRPYRAIIVCPNNVRLNWEKEFAKFATCCGLVTVIRGGHLKRIKALIDAFQFEGDEMFTVVIISYESLSRTWDQLKVINWDLAVADEGHYFKSPTTTRFSAMMQLRDMAKSRVTLTGTPIANTPLDLYSQFEFMGKGFSGFSSWKAWREFYGVFEDRSGHNRLVGVQNLPLMQERLARLSFIIKKEEALPYLPDKVYDIIEVEMSAKQADIYQQLASQLAIEIENDLDSAKNKSLVLSNVLTKLLRLAQITSGFISWDPRYTDTGDTESERVVEAFTPNPKLEALVDCLKEKAETSKTIVWACWTHDINTIKARLDHEKIRAVVFNGSSTEAERVEAERAFNCDRDCKVFVGNAIAGGTGLNLLGYPPGCGEDYDTNCDHVIYYSQNWSSTARLQSEDRAHRRGTRNNVRVSDLCVPETIDEQIRARVLGKIKTALQVSDIKDILKAVLEGVKT